MGYEYYDYGYDTGSAVAGMVGSILVISFIMIVILLVALILMLIGKWKCFKKAGYKGWEALIGGHSQFVNCTFAGVNPILVLFFMFGSVISIIPIIGWLAYIGFLIYYQVVVGINTAKVFGKGIGFGIALAIPLSAPIAWFILGRDNVKYVGIKSDNNIESNVQANNQPQSSVMEQPVVEPFVPVMPQVNDVVEPVNNENNQPLVENNNCSKCGSPVNSGDRFCMTCGNQLF